MRRRELFAFAGPVCLLCVASGCEDNWHYQGLPSEFFWRSSDIVPRFVSPDGGGTGDSGDGDSRQGEAGLPQGCQSVISGEEVCLLCGSGADERRSCLPIAQSCAPEVSGASVCLVCKTPGGKQVAKTCLPSSQTCQTEVIDGRACLVCRDAAGAIRSTLCP
jgi:hypothetical protein